MCCMTALCPCPPSPVFSMLIKFYSFSVSARLSSSSVVVGPTPAQRLLLIVAHRWATRIAIKHHSGMRQLRYLLHLLRANEENGDPLAQGGSEAVISVESQLCLTIGRPRARRAPEPQVTGSPASPVHLYCNKSRRMAAEFRGRCPIHPRGNQLLLEWSVATEVEDQRGWTLRQLWGLI